MANKLIYMPDQINTTENISGSVINGISAYFTDFTFLDFVLTALDIVIVALIIYLAFSFIKGTRATRIIYGGVFLAIVLLIGRLLQLQTLNWAISHITTLVIVAIPVVFQPELRRALEKLGRTKFIYSPVTKKLQGRVIGEVSKAVETLSVNQIGALIIIKRKTGLDEYIETGIKIDGKLTSELLLNLFYPKSPLHDGAVIIMDGRLASASSVLPLSEGKHSYRHGTRHRAAIGITEETDALAIVVSEETGRISITDEGILQENLTIDALEDVLIKLLKI